MSIIRVLFLLLLPLASFGQLKCCFSSATGPTTDTTIHTVSFVSTTSPVQNIARSDSVWAGTITVPYGYLNPSWELIAHTQARTVVATGSGITVSHTFSYLGTDTVNVYTLHVVTQRVGINSHGAAYPTVDWMLPGAVTCLPARFSQAQADVVIDVSQSYTNSNSNFTDFAATGRKIFVKGVTPNGTSTTSKDLSSVASPQTFTTATGLAWTAGRLVKISSNAAPNTNYINATVSSYNSGSGALAVTWAGGQLFGTGVHTDWDIELREVWDPYYWYSSDPLKPVIFEYYNVTIKSTAIRFKGGESQGVIHDGQISEQYQWGVTLLTGHGANGTECLYFEEADGTHPSKNIEFSGFHIDNIAHATGGTGVRFHPNNGTFNATNWVATHIVIHDFLVENANNEAIYLGETTDANTPAYFKHQWCKVYHMSTNHSHNEGIQVGSWYDSEIFKITCLDTGLGAAGGQDYNTQYSLGNRRAYWYMLSGVTDNSGFQGFTGLNGGDQEMMACIIAAKTLAASTIIKLYHNNTYTDLHYRFLHNTFVTPSQSWFNLYNDVSLGAVNATLHVWTNLNAIVSNTTTQHTNNSGFDDSQSVFNNKQYSSSSTPLFIDFANNNFRPRSLSSPLFGSTTNTSDPSTFWAKDYDFDGYKYLSTNEASGAHSGIPLMTH